MSMIINALEGWLEEAKKKDRESVSVSVENLQDMLKAYRDRQGELKAAKGELDQAHGELDDADIERSEHCVGYRVSLLKRTVKSQMREIDQREVEAKDQNSRIKSLSEQLTNSKKASRAYEDNYKKAIEGSDKLREALDKIDTWLMNRREHGLEPCDDLFDDWREYIGKALKGGSE